MTSYYQYFSTQQLAKKYHPDTNKDKNGAQNFQEINEAYEVIHSLYYYFINVH
jgi:curved DNA-binding protein CbpA